MVARFLDRLSDWLAGLHRPEPVAPTFVRLAVPPEDPRLPDASRPRVARMISLIADMEARTLDDTMFVSALAEARQMRDVHLPQLIASYAEIPAAHRAEIFRETGRSASYKLTEALDRMVARLEALSRSMAQGDIDSFADNLRFIEQRYGGDGLG